MNRSLSPIFGYIGLGMFGVTVIVQIMYRLFDHFRPFSDANNIGIGMLLSGANAVFLIFPLLWIIPVCVEFIRFRRLGQQLQLQANQGELAEQDEQNEQGEKDEQGKPDQTVYQESSTKLGHCIKIDYIYFSAIVLQIIYLIMMWEEVNI